MKLKQLVVFVALICSAMVYAEEEKKALDTVYVSAKEETALQGKTTLSRQDLAQRIGANSNINDILQHKPSVRTALGSNNGATQGEITPKNLSFYGERYYNNNFMLNGIGINDNVNPIGMNKNGVLDRGRTQTVSPDALPSGTPQAFWISPDLLESVEVYDSNVPSEFGNFTGGAVNAKLKEPSAERASGSVSYRTTRDRWTKYHFDGDYKEEFEKAYSPLAQPKFVKQQYSFHINQPLNSRSALLFSYDRQQAKIPQQQRYLNRWVKQSRLAETFLLSYRNELDDDNVLKATLLYSPHSGVYFLDNAKNGRFVEGGGGWLGEINWKNYNRLGLLTTSLSYRDNKNRTDYDADILYRYTKTKSIGWISDPQTGEATQGGIGKRFTQQKQLRLKQDLELNVWNLGNSEHSASLGWEFQHNISIVKQPHLAQILSGATTLECYEDAAHPNGVCEPFVLKNCIDCVAGEQYFTAKQLIYPVNAKVNHNRAALYLQDKIKWLDVTLVPGVRFDYTQFTKRVNIAPRFYLNYDLLGVDQTHFSFGLNRYYAGDLIDYKLRSAYKFNDNYTRRPYRNGWELSEPTQFSDYSGGKKLKTPYSDEITLGVSQKIADSLWEFKWVERRSKDQFVTKNDYQSKPPKKWLVNEGSGKTDNFSLEVSLLKPLQTAWAQFSWQFGMSYQKSKSNQTTDYTQSSWSNYGVTHALIGNKLYPITAVPALDFNVPWTANAKLSTWIPKLNLNWVQQVNYLSGYRSGSLSGMRCSDKIPACGDYRGTVAKYNEVKYKRNITLDWFFDWRLPVKKYQALSVNLTVLNVLNRVAKAERITEDHENYYQTYQAGRQFWLGVKYEW